MKTLGKAKRLAQPIQHAGFQLGRRGRGLPDHALGRKHRMNVFGQHGRRGGVVAEIGEETGVLPMGHPGHDDAFEIGKDRFHVFARFGGGERKLAGDVARFHL